MAKILITGGAGFVGYNLAVHLKNKGHTVMVMDNLVRRGSEINMPKLYEQGIGFTHGDIRNKEDFNNHPALRSIEYDVILETAAQPSACSGYRNPIFDITNNYLGLLNVLEYARQSKSKVIFWSTNKVYDADYVNLNPLIEKETRWEEECEGEGISEAYQIDGGNHSIYGLSKVCADLTCQEWSKAFNMDIIVNRFSCLAGQNQWGMSEQGWISWFCIAAILGLPVTLYGWKGKQVRDILFVPDLCKLIDIEIESKETGVFNIGGSKFCNASLLECIVLIEKLTGKRIRWDYEDKARTADHCFYITNIQKARSLLKWEPIIGLKQGVQEIIDWVIINEKLLRRMYA